jgi:hypothetical protein
MIVGFDSCKIPSGTLIALCATINSTYSSVYSATRSYSDNTEKYNKMKELLLLAFDAYLGRNKNCPKEVIAFMNTTPGDQVKILNEMFIGPTKARLDEIYTDQDVRITFVMINVKTSERFFIEDGNQIRNVNAGTLVA